MSVCRIRRAVLGYLPSTLNSRLQTPDFFRLDFG